MEKPTVFLTITDGFADRMLVKTDFLDLLRENFNVVVFGNGEYANFRLKNYRLTKVQKLLMNVKVHVYDGENQTTRIKLMNLKATDPKKYTIIRTLLFLVRFKPFKDAIFHLDWAFVPELYLPRFESHRPKMVICSSGGIKLQDLPFLKTAKRLGISTVGIIQSWDNLTSKGLIYHKCDRFIVWNDIMKQELISLHSCKEEDIFVAGPIHYDLYHKYDIRVATRTKNDTKTILIASSPPWTYRDFDWLTRITVDAIRMGRIKFPTRIVLRLHPNDDPRRYRDLEKMDGVEINYPVKFKESDWEQEVKHLVDFNLMLKSSDVVICVASTMTIDAAYFDTPVINVAFEKDNLRYELSCRRYYDYTHYRNLVPYVRIAYNPDQMFDYINQYLQDRSKDRESRMAIVAQQCKYTDGMSAKRAVEFIFETYRKMEKKSSTA